MSNNNNYDKLAVVTGAKGDLGTAICHELCHAGYFVIAGCHDTHKEKALAWQTEQQEAGFDCEVKFLDVTDFASCESFAKEVAQEHGAIGVLVNNAGITHDASLRKMSKQDWDAVIRTDLDSVFNLTRHVINDMIEKNYGRIINISSINAQKGQFGQTNYSAAKAGIHGFTKALALEVARHGITVNTVSPGYLESKMVAVVDDKIQEQLMHQIPVGRFGKPEEVAHLVAFLAHEQSAYITGANFAINGGMHMY